MKKNNPSMRDIAKVLGTSAVTVSKALAGKPGMSGALRQKILETAAEMGYEYPRVRNTRGEHMEVGILVPDRFFAPESYYAEIYKQLVRNLSDRGHFGVLEILNPKDEKSLALPSLVTVKHVSGLILLGEPSRPYYRMLARTGTPIVFMDFYDELAGADAVTGDNGYGAFRLTSHLIRLGHREIGFVGDIMATTSIMDRFLGYSRAMLMNNLSIWKEWILPDRDRAGNLAAPSLPEKMPTAFVCNCDMTARLMISLLQEKGYRVPDDISVTGFDDYPPGIGKGIPLSTFRVDTDSMISLALQTLLERCAGEKKPFSRMVVSGQPVYRESEKNLLS